MKKVIHVNQDQTMRTVMTMPPTFRTPYNCADPRAEGKKTALECKDPTLAQQHFKDSCDINILFAKYLETGEMPQVMDGLTYGNFEGIFDFQTAMNAVRTAEGLFLQLPARIKNRFDNDPQKLLQFLHNPENREEAEFLGLVNKPEKPDGPESPGTTEKQPQDDKRDTRAESPPSQAKGPGEARSKGDRSGPG